MLKLYKYLICHGFAFVLNFTTILFYDIFEHLNCFSIYQTRLLHKMYNTSTLPKYQIYLKLVSCRDSLVRESVFTRFARSTNEFDILLQCSLIVFILHFLIGKWMDDFILKLLNRFNISIFLKNADVLKTPN